MIARPHLQKAEQEAERAIDEHIKGLDDFFEEAKKGTRIYAEEALSWSSKYRLLSDMIFNSDSHSKYMQTRFEELVFSTDQLEEAVKQVVRAYTAHIHSIENKMLVDLRADISDLRDYYTLAQLNDEQLQDLYEQALIQAGAASLATKDDVRDSIQSEVAVFIVSEVVTQIAIHLGVSAGILEAGAVSGPATFGIGIVVSLIIDEIWNNLTDPQGHLAEELSKKIEEIKQLIIYGSTDVVGLRDRLEQFSRERAASRRTAVLSLLQSKGGTQ